MDSTIEVNGIIEIRSQRSEVRYQIKSIFALKEPALSLPNGATINLPFVFPGFHRIRRIWYVEDGLVYGLNIYGEMR